jgi:hypothetical protein
MKTLYYRIKLWLISWIESITLALQLKAAERKAARNTPEALNRAETRAEVTLFVEMVLFAVGGFIVKIVAAVIVIGLIFKAILFFTGDTMDSTDRTYKDRFGLTHVAHSGVGVKTDWGTGCQYIEDDKGRLTPRMWETREGDQIQLCINVQTPDDYRLLQRFADPRHVSPWKGDDIPEIEGTKLKTKTTIIPPVDAPVQPGAAPCTKEPKRAH